MLKIAKYLNVILPLALALFMTVSLLQPVDAAYAGTIAYGERVSGIADYYGDDWEFYGYAGDVISVYMESDEIDAYLMLYSPSGESLGSNDDCGSTLNSCLTGIRLSSNGWYTINASSLGYNESGWYDLHLQRGNCQADLEYGDRVNDRVSSAGGDRWTFCGEAGEWVRITMRSSDMDPYLELHGPNGFYRYNDDGLGNLNALIYIDELPADGLYTIVARGYQGDTGSYSLTLD